MRAALEWHWIPSSGPLTQQLPVLLEAGTASVIAVTTYSPFGEPERARGRWLPYLRFGTAVALTGIAVGLLSAGAAAAHLPGGTLDVVRNVAGITGIGLISAAVIGGALSWIGPMAYLVLSEYAILNARRTPWIWPARPPHDAGAALCAALAFVAGPRSSPHAAPAARRRVANRQTGRCARREGSEKDDAVRLRTRARWWPMEAIPPLRESSIEVFTAEQRPEL